MADLYTKENPQPRAAPFLGTNLNSPGKLSLTVSRIGVLSRVALFAALYVVLSMLPLSPFIGASSLLTMNIVMIPVFALLLPFGEGILSVLLGGLISIYISPQSAIFGPLTLLLPISGVFFGSLVAQRTKIAPVASIFLGSVTLAYLVARPEFPFWIAPHLLALVLAAGAITYRRHAYHIPAFAFISTMSEQGMMLMLAVYMLNLPWAVFLAAFPLMLLERIVATVGGSAIVVALRKRLPNRFVAI